MTLPTVPGRALVPYREPAPQPLPMLDADFTLVPERSALRDSLPWTLVILGLGIIGLLLAIAALPVPRLY